MCLKRNAVIWLLLGVLLASTQPYSHGTPTSGTQHPDSFLSSLVVVSVPAACVKSQGKLQELKVAGKQCESSAFLAVSVASSEPAVLSGCLLASRFALLAHTLVLTIVTRGPPLNSVLQS